MLRFSGVPSAQLTADVVEIAELVGGRPALAARLASRLDDRRRRDPTPIDPTVVLDTARALAARGDPTTGLFAVALARRGAEYGWSRPWRDLLHALRAHPVDDVRDLAFDISMAAS
ncbi:hypothetical protein [Micromonospora sagamiensis]|uniref:Uncharacterized protein n=1 Tax=Micromonospora sagamiensis TaxID=47875 RepID=A0A562WHQ6_9ACTN|nr:hypothetical protein [Micromonospora sagamiensis]TWJ29417.1 hypothetical protein JD81_02927 [Micromonospora sagamiensis]BCL17553.1 hypothetical protein GCM10017556_52920 [Micromonospora sagamiensis]